MIKMNVNQTDSFVPQMHSNFNENFISSSFMNYSLTFMAIAAANSVSTEFLTSMHIELNEWTEFQCKTLVKKKNEED